jgi:hypothetical protein
MPTCPTANSGSGPWLNDVPKDGVFAKTIAGGPIVYSHIMDCPTQRDPDHTLPEFTWSTGAGNNSWVDYWGAFGQAAADAHPTSPRPPA